jgi:hypothetical protein
MNMGEHLSIKNIIKNPKTAAATLLSGLALAGCGSTHNISAGNEPVKKCGTHIFDKIGLDETNMEDYKTAGSVQAAAKDILILHGQAIQRGGTMDVDGGVSIVATHGDLTIDFPVPAWNVSSTFDSVFGGTYIDRVHFPIRDGKAQVSLGAVACLNGWDHFVDNNTPAILGEYIWDAEHSGK